MRLRNKLLVLLLIISLAPLVLYFLLDIIGTDGIWEARNASDKMCGKERLLDLINAHKDQSAEHIASIVVESVLDFCSDSIPTDDITLVVIKCKI